jgi:2-amino-4-hydroxy-6-hydroxymethyldihydropteridine diphosphokinase
VATAFIALGSNQGDREAYLLWAVERLRQLPRTRVVQSSRWLENPPVGGPPQGMFLNGVVQIETDLAPEELLVHLQAIEDALGRPKERIRWGPRVIDLDLLAYDDLILDTPNLTLPHPRLHERSFVLIPLSELAPHWKHPKLGKTVMELLEALDHAHRSETD